MQPNQQTPYGQPGYQQAAPLPQPPPKKKSRWWLWALGAVVVIGVCTSAAKNGGKKKSAESEAALPFVADVRANCEAYKAAKNEIKKSEVFNANEELIHEQKLTNIKGVLKGLSTNQGGSSLTLRIDVGDVEFKTESLFAPVEKGTAVYKAATDLSEGQCVIFSASEIKASSITEQAKVCDTEYFAKFTSLKGC